MGNKRHTLFNTSSKVIIRYVMVHVHVHVHMCTRFRVWCLRLENIPANYKISEMKFSINFSIYTHTNTTHYYYHIVTHETMTCVGLVVLIYIYILRVNVIFYLSIHLYASVSEMWGTFDVASTVVHCLSFCVRIHFWNAWVGLRSLFHSLTRAFIQYIFVIIFEFSYSPRTMWPSTVGFY